MGVDQPTLFELQTQYEIQRGLDAQRAVAAAEWMSVCSGPGWFWFVKVLRGNDTLLNGSHQAGPYISRRIAFALFPSFGPHENANVAATIPARIDSHAIELDLSVRWYGHAKREAHLTGWGGKASPVLDPEATGSILLMAFRKPRDGDARECRIWLCSSPDEEDAVEERVGPVEPGMLIFYDAGGSELAGAAAAPLDSPCSLSEAHLPEAWRLSFPSAAEIAAASIARLPSALSQSPDHRLVRRRECEYDLFRSVERMLVLPRITEGFATVDLFVDYANSVTNRRKSRSGASLGLHASRIFDEEGLAHSYDSISEGNKRPDFLFPSVDAYHDERTPIERLTVLAAKTTCKDRWRQILNEADRIPVKHLLTLQEGVSLNQFAEMEKAGVVLVVPSGIHRFFHPLVRPKLLSVHQFIRQTLQLS